MLKAKSNALSSLSKQRVQGLFIKVWVFEFIVYIVFIIII